MAWQFAFDQDGTWASGIWQALAGPARDLASPRWTGAHAATAPPNLRARENSTWNVNDLKRDYNRAGKRPVTRAGAAA